MSKLLRMLVLGATISSAFRLSPQLLGSSTPRLLSFSASQLSGPSAHQLLSSSAFRPLDSTAKAFVAFAPQRLSSLQRDGGLRELRGLRRLNGGPGTEGAKGIDAGYAFEEYATKRAAFEPSAQRPKRAEGAEGAEGAGGAWPNYYCNPHLDRTGAKAYHDPSTFKEALKAETSRFVVCYNGKNLVTSLNSETQEVEPIFLKADEASKWVEDEGSIKIYLGAEAGLTYFGLDLSHLDEFDPSDIGGAGGARLEQLRSVGGLLSRDEDAGILGAARGLAVWHRTVKFCANCGSSKVRPDKAGTGRRCGDCGAGFYPRTDPSIIILVTDETGEHILLGRKAVWPEGRYSLLAGFAEMAESLEECCVREVYEESGIRIQKDTIQFASSQPWPFPRSLMIAFEAKAEAGPDGGLPPIDFDKEEMDDVQWFPRSVVREELKLTEGSSNGSARLNIPGRAAVAHTLIKKWVSSM